MRLTPRPTTVRDRFVQAISQWREPITFSANGSTYVGVRRSEVAELLAYPSVVARPDDSWRIYSLLTAKMAVELAVDHWPVDGDQWPYLRRMARLQVEHLTGAVGDEEARWVYNEARANLLRVLPSTPWDPLRAMGHAMRNGSQAFMSGFPALVAAELKRPALSIMRRALHDLDYSDRPIDDPLGWVLEAAPVLEMEVAR